MRNSRGYSARIRRRCNGWPRCPGSASIPRSRSSRKSARRPRRLPPPKHLASWVGACPGHDESAGVNHSHRSPNGNRQMRRLLNQAANAAVKTKGSIFELVYRRLVVRLGHAQTIGAIAHRLCRLVWKILHDGVVYEERGPAVTKRTRAPPRRQDDSRIPKPWLPRRTRDAHQKAVPHDREGFSTLVRGSEGARAGEVAVGPFLARTLSRYSSYVAQCLPILGTIRRWDNPSNRDVNSPQLPGVLNGIGEWDNQVFSGHKCGDLTKQSPGRESPASGRL